MHVIRLSGSASSFHNVSLRSPRVISCDMSFGDTLFTSLCFGYPDAILLLRVSFLSLLVFVPVSRRHGVKVLRQWVWFTQI